jgi:hypothetical protein
VIDDRRHRVEEVSCRRRDQLVSQARCCRAKTIGKSGGALLSSLSHLGEHLTLASLARIRPVGISIAVNKAGVIDPSEGGKS